MSKLQATSQFQVRSTCSASFDPFLSVIGGTARRGFSETLRGRAAQVRPFCLGMGIQTLQEPQKRGFISFPADRRHPPAIDHGLDSSGFDPPDQFCICHLSPIRPWPRNSPRSGRCQDIIPCVCELFGSGSLPQAICTGTRFPNRFGCNTYRTGQVKSGEESALPCFVPPIVPRLKCYGKEEWRATADPVCRSAARLASKALLHPLWWSSFVRSRKGSKCPFVGWEAAIALGIICWSVVECCCL